MDGQDKPGHDGQGNSVPLMSLRIEGLEKRFGAVTAVHGVDLDVPSGSFFTLLGPSGCGKTTILRSIAGIYAPDRGRVVLDGVDVTARPIYARNMALVFQNHALFPHMTAFDNVAFGLRMRRVPRAELRSRVDEALALVRLNGLGARLPAQLSGGQQQRVALARALVVRPSLLLLDEPLSNLDAKLRDELRVELRALQHRLGVTTILVTHDIEEAFVLSDRVAVLQSGRIEQVGTPRELYRMPATRFVAGFVGPANEIALNAIERDGGGVWGITEAGMRLRLPADAAKFAGGAAWLVVRPEHLTIAGDAHPNQFDAVVEDLVYAGASTLCRLRAGALSLSMQMQGDATDLTLGAHIRVGWRETDSVVLRDV
jgi:ABC-type Fe3+/spermidine/putrescine transport system ATPase subunit